MNRDLRTIRVAQRRVLGRVIERVRQLQLLVREAALDETDAQRALGRALADLCVLEARLKDDGQEERILAPNEVEGAPA